jgi:arabinogalactan endo-1,4-beta-galactosidase
MKFLKRLTVLSAITLVFMMGSCSSTSSAQEEDAVFFAKGADVSWLTEMEAAGLKFYNGAGQEMECMSLLKSQGINAVRLRAWVNPEAGWNSTADVLIKAKRAKNLGLKVMIDFHYSDDWADPAKQFKPAAWEGLTVEELAAAVSNHTHSVMNSLVGDGITPEWVQIGNETNDGMLWEEGRASSSMSNFARLVKSGYEAVKAVSPSTQVIVHLSNGYDNAMFRWMFDGLKSEGAKWDIIGLSVYPYWAPQGVNGWGEVNQQALLNMKDLVSRYNTPVMVVEVGMPVNDPTTAKAFLNDILQKTRDIPAQKGLGVFYWEPQCYGNWKGYGSGAFDDQGRPTAAMDAFLE